MPEIDAAALQNLDSESRKEIMQFVEAETSRSKVQSCKLQPLRLLQVLELLEELVRFHGGNIIH
jgi:hypothetical protein